MCGDILLVAAQDKVLFVAPGIQKCTRGVIDNRQIGCRRLGDKLCGLALLIGDELRKTYNRKDDQRDNAQKRDLIHQLHA